MYLQLILSVPGDWLSVVVQAVPTLREVAANAVAESPLVAAVVLYSDTWARGVGGWARIVPLPPRPPRTRHVVRRGAAAAAVGCDALILMSVDCYCC